MGNIQKNIPINKIMLYISYLLILFLLTNTTYSLSLSAIRFIENNKTEFNTGDNITTYLEITNPYPYDIKIKIQDNYILGNNGLDIQCLERTIPKNTKAKLTYDTLVLNTPGEFTINPAIINYTNPETNKPESIKTNKIGIKVNGKQTANSNYIKTIYQCNGINMQSTSYSASSFNYNQNQNMNNQQNQQQNSMNNIQRKMQNNQMNQNSQALKQEIEQQRRQYEQMKNQFSQNLAQNKEFQKKDQELRKQGFKPVNTYINPETNKTGDFKVEYQNQKGEKATISGRMENNTMKQISSLTDSQKQDMLNKLNQNPEFQNLENSLERQGFKPTKTEFKQNGNTTQIVKQYHNDKGEQKNITATFQNQSVKEVKLEDNEKSHNWYLTSLLILLLILILIYIYYKYKKNQKKPESSGESKPESKPKKMNLLKDIKNMLSKSEHEYKTGNIKDAYHLLSLALRTYYSWILNYKKEVKDLTKTELIRLLKQNNYKSKEIKDIESILNKCYEIEFSKTSINKDTEFPKYLNKVKELLNIKT